MIRLAGLDKYYMGRCVLRGVSLDVDRATVVVGPNGSGKSTLLKLVSGIVYPNRGTVYIGGIDVFRAREEALDGVGVLVDPVSFPGSLLVSDVIDIVERNVGSVDELLELLGIESGLYESRIKYLSMGEAKKIRLLVALARGAKIVVLDEPFTNLDERTQVRLLRYLLKNRSGKLLLASTHNVKLGVLLADRIFYLDNCRLKDYFDEGNPREVKLVYRGRSLVVDRGKESRFEMIYDFLSRVTRMSELEVYVS